MKMFKLLGAVAGDVIGSAYEWDNLRKKDFDLLGRELDYTDDTVLTMAVADAIIHQLDFADTIKKYGRNYPGRGYGGMFFRWLRSNDMTAYNSFGNGSAMRVAAAGLACDTLDKTLQTAKLSAEVTHNHPEGIKGAQAVAAAVFLARKGSDKEQIKDYITTQFGYDLDFTLDSIRESYEFNETCQGSVPQAIRAFYESIDYASAIRLAISIGGDSDTIACMTGAIALAYYGEMPREIIEQVTAVLPSEFVELMREFYLLTDGV